MSGDPGLPRPSALTSAACRIGHSDGILVAADDDRFIGRHDLIPRAAHSRARTEPQIVPKYRPVVHQLSRRARRAGEYGRSLCVSCCQDLWCDDPRAGLRASGNPGAVHTERVRIWELSIDTPQPAPRQMNDQPVAAATGSDPVPRRASRSASARLAPPRSSRWSAIISGTTATSFTGTTL